MASEVLEQNSFDILFLSTVTILLEAIPSSCILAKSSSPSSDDDGINLETKVFIGDKLLCCLQRIAACRPLWEFLPSKGSETVLRSLRQLDKDFLSSIHHVESLIDSATNLSCFNKWPDSDAMLIEFLIANADKVIETMDIDCPFNLPPDIMQASSLLCAVLPMLLEAVVLVHNRSSSAASVLKMILRVLTRAELKYRLHLLQSIVHSEPMEQWNAAHSKMVQTFCFQPSSRRFLLSSLCTPQIFHVLLMGCLENEFHENEDSTNQAMTLANYCLDILETLCEHMLNYCDSLLVDEKSLSSWSTVLPALKLLEWKPNNGILCNTSMKSILRFSQSIQVSRF